MSDKVTVYGASDDLIELDGSISEEFNAYDEEEGVVLAFSDGTILGVRYDDEGCWRIGRLTAGTAAFEHEPATDPQENYTDRATLTGNLAWCVMGKKIARNQSSSRATPSLS